MLRAAAARADMTRLIGWLDRGEEADAEIAGILEGLGDPLARRPGAPSPVSTPDPLGMIATARTRWPDGGTPACSRPRAPN